MFWEDDIVVDTDARWITLRVTHLAWTTPSELPTVSTTLLLIFYLYVNNIFIQVWDEANFKKIFTLFFTISQK
jgi:hypothetical protein